AEVVQARAIRDGRVRLVRGAARKGRAAACSELIAEAVGEAIVKFDADVVPSEGAVAALCDTLASGAAMAFGVCEPRSRRRTVVSRGAAHAARMVQEFQRGTRGADFAVG